MLSIVVLVLVKELNEQFKRKIKVVLPVDLVLVSMQSLTLSCFWWGEGVSLQMLAIFSTVTHSHSCVSLMTD